MKNKTAVVIYLYPDALKFAKSLIETLDSQTVQNFDLILFNDGISKDDCLEFSQKSLWFDAHGSPFEIRVLSFKILRGLDYENFIFIDADDSMSDNRIEVLTEWLKNYQIVCNDLNLINSSGTYLELKIWSERLLNGFEFNADFIRDKNIIGFGNVGIKKELLKLEINYAIEPIISDWFVFYQIMEKANVKAAFTNECQTNYRQHELNIAGIGEIDSRRIRYVIGILINHYNALVAVGFSNFAKEIPKLESIRVEDIIYKKNIYPFWWEEIKIVYENN